ASLGKTSARDVACKTSVTRAQATAHATKAAVADAWGDAIARCDGQESAGESLVTALYYGAKASASAGRSDEAIARFAKVEQLFPKHRFADDARMRAAAIVADGGNEAKSIAMLSTLPDAYPDGDMKLEALFRVALASLQKGDLDASKRALDRSIDLDARGDRGRAAYFRARVAAMSGDAADAKKRYAAIVADHPLAYYMLLAYGRLAAADAAS